MVITNDIVGNLPSSSSSSSSSGLPIPPNTTSTQFFNLLTLGESMGQEVTQMQHLNDLCRTKYSKMVSVKDINIKRSQDFPDAWKSVCDSSKGYSRRKLMHQVNISESDLEKAPIETDTNINLNTGEDGMLCACGINDRLNEDKKQNITESSKSINLRTKQDPQTSQHFDKPRSWWKGRIPSRLRTSTRHSSKISHSFRKTRLWNSLSKTLEVPDLLRRDQRKLKKVPKLQIWLSSDSSRVESVSPLQSPVLNNAGPRVFWGRGKVVNRTIVECPRWRALSEGSSPAGPLTHPLDHPANVDHVGTRIPVEKQPTWPVYQLLRPTITPSERPKLRHQNRLAPQMGESGDRISLGKRIELSRQNAFIDESDAVRDPPILNPTESAQGNRGIFGTSMDKVGPPGYKRPLQLRFSTPIFGRRKYPGINLSSRRNRRTLRSCSEEPRGFIYTSGSGETKESLSFNSLTDPPSTPSPSWASSRASIKSDATALQDEPLPKDVEYPSSLNPDHLAAPAALQRRSRSNSNASSILSIGDIAQQLWLAIPGSEGWRSRRPSIFSLRSSMANSPVPYMSIDYGYVSEGEYYVTRDGLRPEARPKLSFTQKLAFPTLQQNSIDRPKPRDPYTEADNKMNKIAKIITVIVLTFVTVFILVGVYRLLH